eukprot:9957082-Ditylum_brightwellii.AAC.1
MELKPLTDIPIVSRRLEGDKFPMTGMQPFFPLRCGAVVKAIELTFYTARLGLIGYKRNGLCVPPVVVLAAMDME